jgi:hypothetical protein
MAPGFFLWIAILQQTKDFINKQPGKTILRLYFATDTRREESSLLAATFFGGF